MTCTEEGEEQHTSTSSSSKLYASRRSLEDVEEAARAARREQVTGSLAQIRPDRVSSKGSVVSSTQGILMRVNLDTSALSCSMIKASARALLLPPAPDRPPPPAAAFS